jgi:hypothetical protein
MPSVLRTPPIYCQYASGPCDQDFSGVVARRGVLLYSSDPPAIAATIEAAAEILDRTDKDGHWATWRDFQTAGQIIFCSICRAMRFADFIVADVTTLNFNVLFEIGFALGLELPVIPIRDTTITKDRRDFDELGLLDVHGYVDFQNAEALAASLLERLPVAAIPAPATQPSDSPLYVVKGPIETEGAVRMMSVIKKSPLRFKTYDAVETPRLALQEARQRIGSSQALFAYLLSPDREGARVHNARCALLAGLAMATAKIVVLIQEGNVRQPIDYRDVVLTCTSPDQIGRLLEPKIRQVLDVVQQTRTIAIQPPVGFLEGLDLGDVAAENEIAGLREYFVRTAQFNEASRGHARLIVGRKGSGKTAIFYALRNTHGSRRSHLVLDLKPEGHQFVRLREAVLSSLTPGLQDYLLTALWNYLLLAEIALKITDLEYTWAQRDQNLWASFRTLQATYEAQNIDDRGDFSERLLVQVELLSEKFAPHRGESLSASRLTELLFKDNIRLLDDAVGDYLSHKEEVWLLIDNLDKGWPTRGATAEDILILRTLLGATRLLQRQLEKRRVAFKCLVFLRNDIYELLVAETPDKGKDTPIVLDWDDVEVFRSIILSRVAATLRGVQSFDEAWASIAEPYVGTQDSFIYIVQRTLMRPRDLLRFVNRAIQIAVNRRKTRVSAEDILKAEESYSEDILLETQFELQDVYRARVEPLYEFLGCPVTMSREEVLERLKGDEKLLDLLVWFGILGVQEMRQSDPRFSYEVRYNVGKLLTPISQGKGFFVVHPAFRRALECVES